MIFNKKASKIWKFVETAFVKVLFVGTVFVGTIFVVPIISSHLTTESSIILPKY